jgi:hypothetical protein
MYALSCHSLRVVDRHSSHVVPSPEYVGAHFIPCHNHIYRAVPVQEHVPVQNYAVHYRNIAKLRNNGYIWHVLRVPENGSFKVPDVPLYRYIERSI